MCSGVHTARLWMDASYIVLVVYTILLMFFMITL